MAGISRAYKRRNNMIANTGGPVLCLDAGSRLSYPGSGLTWTDLSGNGNTGTLTNGPTYSSANGGSIVFDGVDDYVSTNAHVLSNLNAVTLCFWAKPTATNERCEITEGTDGTTRASYGLAEDGNAYILPASTAGYGWLNWSSLGVSNFIYFCSVFDGTQTTNATRAKIYFNGVLVTLTFAGTIPSSVGSFTGTTEIGRRPGGVNYSKGLISSVSIYNRALSDAEISTNFNLFRGRYGI